MSLNLTNSRIWGERADRILPCGAQTLSKAPDRFPGAYPRFIRRGQGCRVWDADGNSFIDWVGALGPIILGYAYPPVVEAVQRQAADGFLFSLEHPLTVEVAEMLCDMVPSAETVRFLKTGSDACSAAVRLARTYTGRDVVLTSGYHGWHSEFQQAEQGRGHGGIPDYVLLDLLQSPPVEPFEFNNLDSLRFALELNVAAVILEPMRFDPPAPGFLEGVRQICDKHGTLLIFDEVVTFGRWPGWSAQAHFGVTPDLTCLGKAMANGMPLAAVVGRRDIMQAFDRCFVSGTYGGETLSLAAAKATLGIIRDEPVVEHIWRQGAKLQRERAYVVDRTFPGYPPVQRQQFGTGDPERDNLLKSLWLQETAKRGVLFGNIQYPSYSHTDEDIRRTLDVVDEITLLLLEAWHDPARYLEGAPIGLDTFTPGRMGR